MRREREGLVVVEPGVLLRSWAAAYRPERSRARHYYSPLDSVELRSRLVRTNEQAKEAEGGVLASFSAAELWAPVVRQHRFFVYWIGDLRPLEGALELNPVGSGENVVVYEPYDEGVLYWSGMADESVTCAVQTYLDLRASPARGEEAAAAIFDRCLKPAYEP